MTGYKRLNNTIYKRQINTVQNGACTPGYCTTAVEIIQIEIGKIAPKLIT